MTQIAEEHIRAGCSAAVSVALKFRNKGACFFFFFLNIIAFQHQQS